MGHRFWVPLQFVIPKKSSQVCTLLLARARARQMACGRFAIFDFWHEKSILNHGIIGFKNLYVLYNRLSGYLHE